MIVGPAKIIGTISAYNKDSVTIDGSDVKYRVPRKFLVNKYFKSGDKIEISLSEEQIKSVKIEEKKAGN
jgi:hypothetical protein